MSISSVVYILPDQPLEQASWGDVMFLLAGLLDQHLLGLDSGFSLRSYPSSLPVVTYEHEDLCEEVECEDLLALDRAWQRVRDCHIHVGCWLSDASFTDFEVGEDDGVNFQTFGVWLGHVNDGAGLDGQPPMRVRHLGVYLVGSGSTSDNPGLYAHLEQSVVGRRIGELLQARTGRVWRWGHTLVDF